MEDWARERYPKEPSDSDFVYKQTIKAKACDAVRGVLPAATISNVGVYGTGQGYEALLLRMRAHPLPEAQIYAQLMLQELRKVIPSFLDARRPSRSRRRVDRLPRQDARRHRRPRGADLRERRAGTDPPNRSRCSTGIPTAKTRCSPRSVIRTRICPSTSCSIACAGCPPTTASRLVHAYVGERSNRRHKPGRAFERTAYRFDVMGDYGAFRDLQRHRMLTIEWQSLTPHHGYDVPEPVVEAGMSTRASTTRWNVRPTLYDALAERFPDQAAYAVSLAYRMRYVMQMNAREAMHLCELRSSPQGHPNYRRIAQAMHRLDRGEGRAPRDRGRDAVRRSRRQRARTTRRRTRGRSAPRRAQLSETFAADACRSVT